MREKLFQKKALSRINSPEELNKAIYVTNPGVWIILTALFVLLLGACCWGIFGRLETTIEAQFIVRDGVVTATMSKEQSQSVQVGQPVRVGLNKGEVIARQYDEEHNQMIITVNISLPEGFEGSGEIVTKYIRPIEFLFK